MNCKNPTFAHFDIIDGEAVPLTGVVRCCTCGRLIPKQDLYRGNPDHDAAEQSDDARPGMKRWIVPLA